MMRTVIFLLGCIGFFLGIHSTHENSWSNKRNVDALITEKWEDWSGEAKSPYKVMFAVEVTDPSGKNGLLPTIYYEKGALDAHEWKNVVPGQTTRVYSTSYKDLGVPPTVSQDSRDSWHSFFVVMLFFIWPFFFFIVLMQWMTEY